MGTFLPLASNGVFYPEDVEAMSLAYENVCHVLHINGDALARETIAVRVIDLARCGELRPSALRAKVLAEARLAFAANWLASPDLPHQEVMQPLSTTGSRTLAISERTSA